MYDLRLVLISIIIMELLRIVHWIYRIRFEYTLNIEYALNNIRRTD